MEQSIIYVQNSEGQPLMPTKRHNKVWYWLRTGQARVVRREPFTIQLCFETYTYTQPVTVGVDTGSKAVGIAAIVWRGDSISASMGHAVSTSVGHNERCLGSSSTNGSRLKEWRVTLRDGERRERSLSKT